MKTVSEIIEVMQAYDRGEQVQILNIDGNWEDKDSPAWNWAKCDYRVKPKKKFVPFDTAEEFLAAQRAHGETVRYKTNDELYNVYINNRSEIILVSYYGHTGSIITNIVNMFDEYEFADGTPCGKEVEE